MSAARAVLAALLATCVLVTGCSAAPTPTPETGDRLGGTVTVFAAASLRGAFHDIATAFTDAHPGVTVAPRYDGSPTLVTQLTEGAHADVLATADEANMRAATDAGRTGPPRLFATNSLVVAVPKGNPGRVTRLADLPGVVTVLCAPQVPCGAASRRLLGAAGVTVTPASLEQNVTAVLAKVAAGEADAGLVYATDVIGDQAVESFVPDGAAAVLNHYPIAATTDASAAGRAFVDFVLGPTGARILGEHGFGKP